MFRVITLMLRVITLMFRVITLMFICDYGAVYRPHIPWRPKAPGADAQERTPRCLYWYVATVLLSPVWTLSWTTLVLGRVVHLKTGKRLIQTGLSLSEEPRFLACSVIALVGRHN